VTIARINTDISVADFELAVNVMIKDVEDLYWDLYLAYRQYDADEANREKSYKTWQGIKALMDAGAEKVGTIVESQVRESYFETLGRTEVSLSNLYVVENQFRKLLGLPVNDGRLIRPNTDPLEAEFIVNWDASLLESLSRRVELRRQKWQIKSLELQRMAAENVTNPRLDLVSSYQLNGFGDQLLSQQSQDGVTVDGFNSAYSTMARGDLTGWGVGLQFSMPIGFRQARAQLHNTELQLIKARATLLAQEQDISHELAEAIQRIDAAYVNAQTQLNRKIAAAKREESYRILQDIGARAEPGAPLSTELDLRLRAQNSNAAAEFAYFNSLIAYNKAITEYHWRRGTLLEHNGVHVAEAEWTEAAQHEALRRAWARSFASPNENLSTEPPEFSSPVAYPKTDLYPGLPQGAVINSVGGAQVPSPTPATETYEGEKKISPPDESK
jgi:outer membrane protein TolC